MTKFVAALVAALFAFGAYAADVKPVADKPADAASAPMKKAAKSTKKKSMKKTKAEAAKPAAPAASK